MFLINISNLRDESEQVQAARSLLDKYQVQVSSCTKWDERKLYTEIKGQKRAAYVLAFFHADSLIINKLYADCELADHILRVLIVIHDPTAISAEAAEEAARIEGKITDRDKEDKEDSEEEEEELVEN